MRPMGTGVDVLELNIMSVSSWAKYLKRSGELKSGVWCVGCVGCVGYVGDFLDAARFTTRAPHGGVAHRTCGEPNDIEMTATHP